MSDHSYVDSLLNFCPSPQSLSDFSTNSFFTDALMESAKTSFIPRPFEEEMMYYHSLEKKTASSNLCINDVDLIKKNMTAMENLLYDLSNKHKESDRIASRLAKKVDLLSSKLEGAIKREDESKRKIELLESRLQEATKPTKQRKITIKRYDLPSLKDALIPSFVYSSDTNDSSSSNESSSESSSDSSSEDSSSDGSSSGESSSNEESEYEFDNEIDEEEEEIKSAKSFKLSEIQPSKYKIEEIIETRVNSQVK